MNKTTQTQLQIRIDEKTKKKAQATLEEMGLDLSSGIKIFLRNVVATGSIPFDLVTENGFALKQEMEILRETEETLKKGKRYAGADDLFDDIK